MPAGSCPDFQASILFMIFGACRPLAKSAAFCFATIEPGHVSWSACAPNRFGGPRAPGHENLRKTIGDGPSIHAVHLGSWRRFPDTFALFGDVA